MKHAVKQRKLTVKPKTKSLTTVKAVSKTNSTTKTTGGTIASNSRVTKSVSKIQETVKPARKTAKLSAKVAPVKASSKLSAKTLDARQTSAKRNKKPVVQVIEKSKKNEHSSKLPAKATKITAKTAVNQSKKNVASKAELKAKPSEKIIKNKTAKPATKRKSALKAVAVKTTNVVKTAPKNNVKKAVKPIVKADAKKAKASVLPSAKIDSKTKAISQKPKLTTESKKSPLVEKTQTASEKLKKAKKSTVISVKNQSALQKPQKNSTVAPQKIDKKSRSIKSSVEPTEIFAKKIGVKQKRNDLEVKSAKAVIEKVNFTPVAPTENIVWKRLKFKPAISSAKTVKDKQKVRKIVVPEQTEPIAKIEEIKPQPTKPKKGKPIGSAIFRGKKERYNFKMFELNDVFDPIPAVYIISKRKTDRNKRGHHSLVCIGQTASILDELKRHRKGKCVKKHAANVVSILPEADEKTRLQIEIDLKAAHTIECNFG